MMVNLIPTTPSNKNKQGFNTNIPISNPNTLFVDFCCLTKPRKSEAPVVKKIGAAELPK